MSEDYHVGDLVWAKMKGYPPWPAKIAEPTLEAKAPKNKKAHFVYFFGSKDYAWIMDENISPHSDMFLNSPQSKKKSGAYQNAIDAFLKFSKNNKERQITPRKETPTTEAKKSPQSRVVKVINSVQKKAERKVLNTGEPDKKVVRKRLRSLDRDVNGKGNEYKTPPKVKRIESRDHKHDNSNSYSDIESMSADDANVSMYDEYIMSLGLGKPEMELKSKHVLPTRKKIGFIGLGHMGKAIVANLLKSGHDVTVWNKTTYKCDDLKAIGAKKAQTPAELIIRCDITFCCVSDPEASKSLIFGERGILKGLEQAKKMDLKAKGYVEMTSLDPETSSEIAEAVDRKHGKYLEAPLCGTSKNALEGTLLVLAAGDKNLFLECETCFHAMGKKAYYINCSAGAGAKMSIILSALSGTLYGALAEAMVLSKRLSLPETDFLKIFCEGPLRIDNLIEKGNRMMTCNFETVTPLKHMQKDLHFCLLMGDQVSQHTPVFAAVNEVYKRARLLKYSDYDVSAVFQGVRY